MSKDNKAHIAVLRRKEENLSRMATVVRDSNNAITIQDFEGRITAWNRGAELMYGYSEEEALLANIDRLTPPARLMSKRTLPAGCWQARRSPRLKLNG